MNGFRQALRAIAALGLSMMIGAPLLAFASQLPTDYTYAKRYSTSGQFTGSITPAAADRPGEYPAIRHSINAQGLVAKTEEGVLSAWPGPEIEPKNWESQGFGFSIHTEVSYVYDNWGRKTIERIRDHNGSTKRVTQYSYDSMGRPECVAIRMNPATYGSLPSSACSMSTQGIYGPDRITRNEYDTRGRINKVIKAYNTPLQQVYKEYTYVNDSPNNPEGALWDIRTVTDANANTTRYEYDGFGRLWRWYFPHKTAKGTHSTQDYEQYTYDNNGNRTALRKRDGSTINYQYDRLSRMTRKTFGSNDHEQINYQYNLLGLQTSAQFRNGSGITRNFDGYGQLLSETSNVYGTAYTVGYGYDAHGSRTHITYPDGTRFDYAYDELDRVREIQDPSNNSIASYNFSARGQRSEINRGNGVTTSYHYDGISRLLGISHGLSNSTHSVSLDFSYNPANQVVDKTLSNSRYHYVNSSRSDESYAANGLNQYTSINGRPVHYDANGNLTGANGVNYQYDRQNRLTRATGAKVANLRYDPAGRLYQLDTGAASSRTRFVYAGDSLIAEYNNSGNLIRRYVHGSGIDEPVVMYNGTSTAASNRRYYHQDHQGSIMGTTTHSGASDVINRYDAWGIPAPNNQGRFSYTGQIYLPELDLYYYRARMYSPYLGRFLQTDPIGYEDQMNLYAYVHNDPLNYTDPTGMSSNNCDTYSTNASSCKTGAVFRDSEKTERGSAHAQESGGFFSGAGSFFRGLSRYARHEGRVLGWAGAGEAVQANTVEKMLLGEALGIALHANQTSIKAGGNRLLANGETIAGRQLMSLLGGAALGGGGAGPSLGILAGMGDVYFGIESLALELKLNISTVDHNRPILPQISDDALRGYAEQRLGNMFNTFLSGQN